MPDIEKRLEAFVRTGHGIIVFPGGAGTAEEILYILGILLHPENAEIPFPLIFTGPESSRDYFAQINEFIGVTLGEAAQKRYKIIVDDPESVAREMQEGIKQVREYRKGRSDAYYFNWALKIDQEFQRPFAPTHENMRCLQHRAEPRAGRVRRGELHRSWEPSGVLCVRGGQASSTLREPADISGPPRPACG